MKYKFVRERDERLIPRRATPGSAGLDLVAAEDIFILKGGIVPIPTGICLELPPGTEGQIRSRSGLAAKGIVVANSPGTIDPDYRGEIQVLLINLGLGSFKVEKYMRIAQLVLARVEMLELEEAQELNPTCRQEGGFGSSGL